MIILTILSLSALSVFAQAPSRQQTRPRLSIASRDFTVTNFGAIGDGQALTDCSIQSGSDRVICATGKFGIGDVGKAFALYGAGTLLKGYQQPLAGTITNIVSANEAVLSIQAQATVTNSERFVWGTNNTAAIQAAVDAAADAGGGEVSIPEGHYLTEGAYLDCAVIGKFPGYGYRSTCIRAYNNISLKGREALTTVLENWNPDVKLINGLIDLGKAGEIPGLGGALWPPKRLANIEVSGLTLRQVKYPTRPIKVLYAYATEDISVHDCSIYGYSYEGIYMGGGFKSIRWRVFNNVAYEIGKGGPAYGNSTSAYNLNGSYVEAFNNRATNCGQCFEAGARHATFTNNLCENNIIAFHIGSTGSGIWNVTMTGNFLKNNYYALISGNGNGTIHDIRFLNNMMIDTPDVVWNYGANKNTVVEVEADTVIHSQSEFSGNTFIFTDLAKVRTAFRIFQNPTFLNVGSDSITIANNIVSYPGLSTASPYLIVGGLGGQKWEPAKSFLANAPAVGSMWGAYWYKATTDGTTGVTEPIWPTAIGQTVQDGSITWICMGERPQVFFRDNRATFPPDTPLLASLYSTWPGAIRIDYGVREMLKVTNFQVVNMDWRMQVASPDMHEELVPRDGPYSDTRRYSKAYTDGEPIASYWSIGTFVQKRNIQAGIAGWIVTRSGYAAPVYSSAASYSAFGTFVRPSTDNGKIYQLVGGSCANVVEPVWPDDIGQTVTAQGCIWKAVQNSAKFTPLR